MTKTLLVVLVTSLVAAACGGEEMAPPINVTIANTNAASDDPVEGVEVCVQNFPGFACQTSGADGMVTVQAPANEEVLFSFTGMNLYPGLHMLTTGETDLAFESEVAPRAIVNVVAASGGAMLVPGTAQILLRAVAASGTGDPTGFTFALEPAPAMGQVVYFDESQIPMAALTETTLVGAAAIINTTPGDYDLVVMHATRTCDIEVGWERAASDRVGLRAVADNLTVVKVVNCM